MQEVTCEMKYFEGQVVCAVLEVHCVAVIIPIELYRECFKMDSIPFTGVSFGFLDFTDHPIIHRLFLLSVE